MLSNVETRSASNIIEYIVLRNHPVIRPPLYKDHLDTCMSHDGYSCTACILTFIKRPIETGLA